MKKRVLALALILILTAALAVPAMAAAPSGAKYWSFDDDLGGAQITDNIANINPDGTIKFADGKVGKAVEFPGTKGLFLGDDIIKGKSYTVAMWVNPKRFSDHTPFFWGVSGNETFSWVSFLPHSWAGAFGIWSDNPAGWVDFFGAQMPAEQWSHVAFTVDNGAAKIYLNGKEISYTHLVRAGEEKTTSDIMTGDGLVDIYAKGGKFYLGVNQWDAPLQALVDEVYIYNKALSAADIGNVMNAGGGDAAAGGDAPASSPSTGDGIGIFIALGVFFLAGCGIVIFRKVKA